MAGHAGACVDLAIAELTPAAGRIVLIVLAVHQRHDLAGAAGGVGRGRRKFPLVLVVDLHRLTEHRHILRRGLPSEVGVFEQFVIPFQSGQVVTVGIAVALREHPLGIRCIHHAVGRAAAGFFLDVVVGGVEHLAAVDAAGVVPPQAVVGRSCAHARIDRIIAPLEQCQLFLQRAGHLALEREATGVHFGAGTGIVDRDRRIRRVGVGLVAEDGVKVIEITGRQNQPVVG